MSKSTGNESDDCQNDLRKATELSICDLAVSIFYNVGRRSSGNKKTMAKGNTMVDGNKRNLIDEDKEKSYQNIISKLCDLQDNNVMPFATKIVRDVAERSSLRNNQNNVYLPPSFKSDSFMTGRSFFLWAPVSSAKWVQQSCLRR